MSTADGSAVPGVGIVVVSHSRMLASAAVALATEMVHGTKPRIAVAAGLDDTTFGTDAVAIASAIESVDSAAGVVVLMDLGSAILSAELALDLLPTEQIRERVLLCPAPLVEGLLVAAVSAAGGASREEVANEACGALLGKVAQLRPEAGSGSSPAEAAVPVAASFTVLNEHGLHARPAARLVTEMRRFDATVQLRNVTTGGAPVPARSLSRVATLGALYGHVIEASGSGPQARDALNALVALAQRRFGETAHGESVPADRRAGRGPLPGSPGVGAGPARRLVTPAIAADAAPVEPPAGEWRQLAAAIAKVRRDVERSRNAALHDGRDAEAGIFDAHLLLLEDAELLGDARRRVDGGLSAGGAWAASAAAVEQQWSDLADPYLRARAGDIRAVANQVLHALVASCPLAAAEVDGVLLATDLTPAEAASLDPALTTAVVLAEGSPNSHALILIRALGIPAVVSAGPAVLDTPDGTLLVVDGTAGRLGFAPETTELARYQT